MFSAVFSLGATVPEAPVFAEAMLAARGAAPLGPALHRAPQIQVSCSPSVHVSLVCVRDT